MMHWSDCAVYNAPAYAPGPCDCGGLESANDPSDSAVIPFVALSVIAAAVFVFGLGVGWDKLNNRIDKVDAKIGEIQKTLGSTACHAILSRQMEAIDKNKASVREALDKLSSQYDCGPRNDVVVVPDFSTR